MSDDSCKWDDNELMDCKDIFIKMMDFIRNYDSGNEEYSRRIRLDSHSFFIEVYGLMLTCVHLMIQAKDKPYH